MIFWRREQTFHIPLHTQIHVCEYLLNEYRARLTSPCDERTASGMRVRQAATEFINDANKPQLAIRVLKSIWRDTQRVIPKLDSETADRARAEVISIETMLEALGVTDFKL